MEAWIAQEYGGRMRLVLVALGLLLLQACAAHRPPPDEPAGGPPYTGLFLAETSKGGALVVDLLAGPGALAGLLPGDRILSVGEEAVDAAKLRETISASRPGSVLPLTFERGGQTHKAEVVVGDAGVWTPPARLPSRVPHVAPSDRPRTWLDEIEVRRSREVPALDEVAARVDGMLREVAAEASGYNRLPLARQVLADPGALVALEQQLGIELANPAEVPTLLAPLLCRLLALECDARMAEAAGEARTLQDFTAAIADANAKARRAFSGIGRAAMHEDVASLLRQVAAHRTLLDRPKALAGIRAMRYSERVDIAALAAAFHQLLLNALRAPREMEAKGTVPSALRAMVEGEILAYAQVDGGYVVVGGGGANRYRMDRLYAVIDLGGDDHYVWTEALPPETQSVVDYAGNDRYEARIAGPGAGWLGVAVLLDFAGADTYATTLGGCGAGVYGFGLLFDADGNDGYRCDAWSSGAGIYGGGVLVDAGSGADSFVSQVLSQGVGGPGGVGLLVDGGGNDLYRANGPVPSAYGTPAVHMAFSQGVGFGIRPYDHGGFGALLDHGGSDRYEGGEFSQGGGYYHGVGLLRDASGDDFYYGNRYAQGFGCHQAAGLLADLEGNDVYWAMTAAAQGAAWDQSVGLLYEGGGNDVYRAEALSQGAAAQQARAWLYDADGDDDYRSRAPSVQGAATDNGYHYRDDDPVVSLGVLFDARGVDRYSSGLDNGATRVRHDPASPRGRGNAGIAIDAQDDAEATAPDTN